METGHCVMLTIIRHIAHVHQDSKATPLSSAQQLSAPMMMTVDLLKNVTCQGSNVMTFVKEIPVALQTQSVKPETTENHVPVHPHWWVMVTSIVG